MRKQLRIPLALTGMLVGTLLLTATRASAEMYPAPQASVDVDRPWSPGAALSAAALNLAYVPPRAAISMLGAGLSGVTGFLTGGNKEAADDVWNMLAGSPYLTPGMLQGREPFRFGPWDTGR